MHMVYGNRRRINEMASPNPTYVRKRRYRVQRGRKKFVLRFLLLVVLLLTAALAVQYAPALKTKVELLFPSPEKEQDMVVISEEYVFPKQNWYVLRLLSNGTETEALTLADTFRARGAGGYTYTAADGYAVAAAAYDTREKAAAVQKNLLQYHQVETDVEVWSAPQMQIRLTGNQRQLNAMKDSYDFLFSLSSQMLDCFIALDEGTQSREQAEKVLASCMETAQVLRENLVQVFSWLPPLSGEEDGFLPQEHVKELLLQLHSAMQQALREDSAVRFGAGVKQVHLICAHGLTWHAQALPKGINIP